MLKQKFHEVVQLCSNIFLSYSTASCITLNKYFVFSLIAIPPAQGHYEVVEFLLKKGANPNTDIPTNQTLIRMTPLLFAATNGHLGIAKLLIKYGADLNKRSPENVGILEIAIDEDNLEMVELLIKSGIELEYKAQNYLMSPFHRAVSNGHYDIAKLLISHGADINSRLGDENTPMHTAIMVKNIRMVKLLLSHGVDINIKGIGNHTPLQTAVTIWHYEIVEFLLENGANVNEEYADGCTTLLHIACQNGGHNNITEILIKYGAKLDALDENGCAPIHFAADEGLHLIVRNLLKKGNITKFSN